MTYDEAVQMMKKGNKVMRPHWHWCHASLSEHSTKLAMFDESDGHERGPYRPTHSDRKATDWVAVLP